MKDHEIRDIVNIATALIIKYSGTEQLRERVADCIMPLMSEITALRAEIERLRGGIADEARMFRGAGHAMCERRMMLLLRPKPAAPPPTAG